jgi:hypothetical protein
MSATPRGTKRRRGFVESPGICSSRWSSPAVDPESWDGLIVASQKKRIRLSLHARDRMSERNSTWADIKAALKDREIVAPYRGGGSRIYSPAGSKPIIVGIREYPKEIVVITTMNWEKKR